MSLLAGRKILIVGGNGFVGNRVAARLVNNHAHVSVLSRYLRPYPGMAPGLSTPRTKKLTGSSGAHLNPSTSKRR